jgi:hypothetical protein
MRKGILYLQCKLSQIASFLLDVCLDNSDLSKLDKKTPEHILNCATLTVYYKLRGLSPQANYTDRATAPCLRS